MKKIIIIGGGTGTSTIVAGLKKFNAELSVIVSTADDGGSTGILRRQLGVLPPGDMRQCLVALSGDNKAAENFNFRFSKGELKGHVVGNLILANLEKKFGINKALDILYKSLKVKGQVIPVTLKPTLLTAILQNGKKIVGEHNIDEQDSSKQKTVSIKQLHLTPAKANPKAIEALKKADIIVFGPGDLYTSTLPNLLVSGISGTINKSKAKKILITNIVTKYGQTDGFKASDFVKVLEKYLKGKIDIALVNNQKPKPDVLKKYAKEKSFLVEADTQAIANTKVESIIQGLISEDTIKKTAGDKLKRSFIRHDSTKLAKLIWNL